MNSPFAIRVALLLVLAAISFPVRLHAADTGQPQYYEIVTYTTTSVAQQQRINDYWQNAAVPAYNRLGCSPIGVFTELKDSDTNKVYVFIPYNSADAFTAISGQLAADTAYQAAAADFLNATKTNAAYQSFSTALLVAFDSMKHLVMPPAGHKPNVFELRTYISPSENKGLNKIQMVESGEIDLMNQIGFAPIFFGRTLSGPVMPSLMYLTCAPDLATQKKHWTIFDASTVWKQLLADPQFKDNMAGAIKVILKRTPASQI